MARKLFHGARGAAAAARHLGWFLSYCLDGSATRPYPADDPGAEDAVPRAS